MNVFASAIWAIRAAPFVTASTSVGGSHSATGCAVQPSGAACPSMSTATFESGHATSISPPSSVSSPTTKPACSRVGSDGPQESLDRRIGQRDLRLDVVGERVISRRRPRALSAPTASRSTATSRSMLVVVISAWQPSPSRNWSTFPQCSQSRQRSRWSVSCTASSSSASTSRTVQPQRSRPATPVGAQRGVKPSSVHGRAVERSDSVACIGGES